MYVRACTPYIKNKQCIRLRNPIMSYSYVKRNPHEAMVYKRGLLARWLETEK